MSSHRLKNKTCSFLMEFSFLFHKYYILTSNFRLNIHRKNKYNRKIYPNDKSK